MAGLLKPDGTRIIQSKERTIFANISYFPHNPMTKVIADIHSYNVTGGESPSGEFYGLN